MKKIIILFLTVMSLQIFGANYKVTGNNLTQKELKTNNSEIEKVIKKIVIMKVLILLKIILKFSRMSLQKGQEGMKNWKKHIPV